MVSQWLSRNSKKVNRRKHLRPRATGLTASKPIHDLQTGFIHHPVGFPLECKRVWFDKHADPDEPECTDIGLIFESEKYIKPGATIEVTIPLRNETESFRGKVVLVRHNGDFFEIGLWLNRRSDASRARIVEQICHIETYLKQKKYREGPYNLNPDQAAEEWINQHASTVPTL
jgi:hypothetical protein